MERISIREFGRRLQCSDTYVHKAIKAGKIKEGLERKRGKRPRIIYEVALKEWRENVDITHFRNPEFIDNLLTPPPPPPPAKIVKKKPGRPKKKIEPESIAPHPPVSSPTSDTVIPTPLPEQPKPQNIGTTLQQAQLKEKVYKAQMAELEYDIKRKKYVERASVDSALFEVGVEIRKKLMGLTRYLDEIMAKRDRRGRQDHFEKILRDLCQEISEITEQDVTNKAKR